MDESAFERLINELCDVTGIADRRSTVAGGHIEVDGRVVGLINDPEDSRTSGLTVHVELDAVEPERDTVLLMLRHMNVRRPPELKGRFGVHSGSGRGVYSFDVTGGPELDGAALAAVLAEQVPLASWMFNEITSPH